MWDIGRSGPTRRRAGRIRGSLAGEARGDTLFRLLLSLAGAALAVVLVLIILVLLLGALDSIMTFGFSFLITVVWRPPALPPEIYGAVPFVYGTVLTSALALLLGVPLSIGIAVFLSELAPRWLRVPLSYVTELLAAIPSVVYGLWAIFVLAPLMRTVLEPALQSVLGFIPLFQGSTTGVDVLTASVVLALMIIPTVSAVSRDALLAVPQSQREAAFSLGATRAETTRIAVLRYARSGLFGAAILGLGRAMGETMAVAMTIGNRNAIPTSLFSPGGTVASWIANNFTEAGALELSALIELGLVLMLLSIVVNFGARILMRRFFRSPGASM